MLLVVVRHGKAEERSDFFADDRLRPLTSEGIEKMKDNAKALRKIVPHFDVLFASPLVRAQQTAEILKDEYGQKKIETTDLLSPGFNRPDFLNFLKKQNGEVICLVGHEPDLGELCSWFLSGNSNSFIPFKKGGICILEFPGQVGQRSAFLIGKLDPRHL